MGERDRSQEIAIPAERLLADMRSMLSAFGTFAHSLRESTNYLPASESEAEEEWATDQDDKMGVQTAYSLAATLLAAAQAQLESTARILVEPLPELGVYATTRAAMENAARAWWLLAPGLTPQERSARGLVERMNSLHETSMVLDLVGTNKKDRTKQKERLQQVEAEAVSLGFTVTRSPRAGLRIAEVPRKSPTALLRDMHGDEGELVYRLLSAAVHGTTYALLQGMEFVQTDKGNTGYIARPDKQAGTDCSSRPLRLNDLHGRLYARSAAVWLARKRMVFLSRLLPSEVQNYGNAQRALGN